MLRAFALTPPVFGQLAFDKVIIKKLVRPMPVGKPANAGATEATEATAEMPLRTEGKGGNGPS